MGLGHESGPDDYDPMGETVGGEPRVTAEDYRASFGEDLLRTLDLDTWLTGEDLSQVYHRLAGEVRQAVQQEERLLDVVRQEIFPRITRRPSAPPCAGVYAVDLSEIEKIHRGLLFNGGVEACDGTRLVHDTLPLTIMQIGITLVSYQGNQGTWSQRLFRRDLRMSGGDPVDEMLELLARRDRRAGLNQTSPRDQLSELAQRGIMAYAERAILLRRSSAIWRMGHGSPAPYELITGSGSMDLMIEGTKIIRALVEEHQKFVFVASEPRDRVLLTIGQALRPLQFAIVGTLAEQIAEIVGRGHYRGELSVDHQWDGEELTPGEWIRRFRDRVASQVVVGVYRATTMAPPQVFYAHAEHAELAAAIALADSILQEHRGFPLLIDLAHGVGASVFGQDTLRGPVAVAYADLGAPWRYETERTSRIG
jgi:hypothetical protein